MKKFNSMEIMQSMFSQQNEIKLEIGNRIKFGKYVEIKQCTPK